MAKRSTAIIRQVPMYGSGAAPIIRVAAPRAVTVRKKSRRRSSSSGSSSGSIVETVLAGAGTGMLLKSSFAESIPVLGPLGKKGTLALGLHVIGKSNKWARLAARGLAFMAGCEYMENGSVSGE